MNKPKVNRRRFFQAASIAITGHSASHAAPTNWDVVNPPPDGVNRVWIGPAYWANRLQDWRLANGRIESVNVSHRSALQTVAVLPREINPEKGIAHARIRLSRIEGGNGFAGLLIGAGGGKLDWRAAALVQQASGEGGGILCTWEADGQLRFREHIDEQHPHAYAERAADKRWGSVAPDGEAELQLTIEPVSQGTVKLTFVALDPVGAEVAGAVLDRVDETETAGSFLLAVCRGNDEPGARYAFNDVRTSGPGMILRPERRLGPIVGALHSLNGRVLKLTAQLFPVGDSDPRTVQLDVREGPGEWRRAAESRIEPGNVAVFRIGNWDATRDRDYRVVYGSSRYRGTIRSDPAAKPELTIGMINCLAPVGRNLDGGAPPVPLPGGAPLVGRYTAANLAFPFTSLIANVGAKRPDVLIFSGDQIYEGRPTRTDPSESPTLDYLYKWYLWHLSFRDLTRDTPAIVQVDDHDVYQGNIWGQGGRPAPEDNQNRGGYVRNPEWVNMVQRTQCGHLPDAYDPTPIAQGITVYYGAFRYGGVNFAILEDRKFKTGAILDPGFDVADAELLGQRQEDFLTEWSRRQGSSAEPKICLTQTTFACVQTGPDGKERRDPDSNGFPKHARDRALRLIREAGALILSGDQHLTHTVRHGLDSFDDGPVQFTAPAGASLFARWFEPAAELPNSSGQNTGDFEDGFGNRFRVLAVANPVIGFAEYRRHRPERGQGIEDAQLRADGFGVVRVDKEARSFVIECWPAGNNPKYDPDRQFAGWPVRIDFDKAG